jgi:hypothetical protein
MPSFPKARQNFVRPANGTCRGRACHIRAGDFGRHDNRKRQKFLSLLEVWCAAMIAYNQL